MEDKTKGQTLEEKLIYKPKKCCDEDTIGVEVTEFCNGYKAFLNAAKTEREAVNYTVDALKSAGFTEYKGGEIKSGDKVYLNNRGKSILAMSVGSAPVTEGINLSAAHIDSPRLDLKPNPLFEKQDMAFFRTHYYGGIKKYQWTTVPLSLHGTIIKADGLKVDVCIGETEDEPVFTVNDLLIHLANEQMQKPAKDVIAGENLCVLIGSLPFKDDKVSEKVKLNILSILFEKYGITERDFITAELSAVPAYKASDVGLDRSMVGSYGQDDRVCAYTSLMGFLNAKESKKSSILILSDKEEVGSMGNTGMKSAFFIDFIKEVCEESNFNYRKIIQNIKCLSADVNAAYDPIYPEVLEEKNCSYFNGGAVLTKYTGSRGKSGTSDASAELMHYFTSLFDKAGVIWQTGELGKVDQGGGGTVAQYIANLDIDVVDLGVAVLSMHSPFEVTSKCDVYMTYKAFLAHFSA